MAEHIENFQKLNIRVADILEEHRIDVLIGTLKDNIQHEVFLWEPNSLYNELMVAIKVESKVMATGTSTTHNYKHGSVSTPSFPKPTRLKPQKLEEKREKNILYSCDRKYTKAQKCVEKKLFYIDFEEE